MSDLFHQLFDLLQQLDPRVLAYLVQIGRLCIWLVLLAVIFLPLERLFALHPKQLFRKGVAHDLFYYFLSSLTPAIALTVPISVLAWGVHALVPGSYVAWVAGTPVWARAVAALVVGEIGFYWGHRWSHESPFLWGFHAVHHSAEHMDFLVNTRAHPVDIIFTRLCGLVPMYLLGVASPVSGAGGLIPVLVVLVGTVWGFFIHSNLRWRLGPMEHIIATPAFHHWHHTNDSPDVFNKNYSSMLPWLDRIFGTLHLPRDRHPGRYGIDEQLAPSVLGQMVDPFRSKSHATRSEDRERSAAIGTTSRKQ
jgi:sterol desaturase/sphingolipid hydroxylase (fatty acid hydroxylase superfamily)